jgi:transposase-like protein
MATAEAPKRSAPRRRWPAAEKRRIVELTLRAGASIGAIAREHGLHASSLSHWKALYRAGRLDAQAQSSSRAHAAPANATFVPVSLVRAVRRPQPATRGLGPVPRPARRLSTDACGCGSAVVQLVFGSGVTLRIETDALDAALVCALVAELQR